jgi:hypothetical protein
MTYAKLERIACRLRQRADEEWKKLDGFYPAKKLDTQEEWVEFDGDDYFTQIKFYWDCSNVLTSIENILLDAREVSSMVVILKYENDFLEKLGSEVNKTRSTMKSLNYETSTIRIDFSKLLETYEKQRKLVASLEEDIQAKKLETNVEVSQEIMTFLDKYAN